MPSRTLTVDQLTDYLHLHRGDVERLLKETDIPHETRGGRPVFRTDEIDAWASKRILRLKGQRLAVYHAKSTEGTRNLFPEKALIPELMRAEYIDLEVRSKTAASAIRDLVNLADKTGRVLDARELLRSVREREALCSTALPGGFALLHARQLAPYRVEGSFIVVGRTIQAVPFGAVDGQPTRLFFLICCEDERIHLHTLARLCLLAMKTKAIDELMDASTAAEAYEILVRAEASVLG